MSQTASTAIRSPVRHHSHRRPHARARVPRSATSDISDSSVHGVRSRSQTHVDTMDNSRNQHLGVNKISKNIRKSPLHHPNYSNPRPPPQPQVYNISKNDFRSIVQQLTGTPSRDAGNPNPPSLPPPSRPPHPKPPSMRLQKIRPPPLTPIARPPPPHIHHPPNHSSFIPRPGPAQPGHGPGPAWAESPVSAYMRYLESSLLSSDPHRSAAAGLLPSPSLPPPGAVFPSPRSNQHYHPYPHHHQRPPSAFSNPPPGTPPGMLPSPGSQFPLQSPSGFLNLLSPRSPNPLLSPGFQYPPPLTPNFSFSPLGSQSGILGPGPLSPGLLFPQSPSGFLPLLSPRWRDL